MTMAKQMHRFTSTSLSLMAFFSGSVSAAIEDTAAIQITTASKAGYESLLNAELNHWLNVRRHFDDQRGRFLVSTRIDPQSRVVIVELGREFGPHAASPEMEDISKEVSALTDQVLQGVMVVSDIDLRFGGGTIYDWFPELQPQAGVQLFSPAQIEDESTAGPIKVLVSAGHGAYYHHRFKKWTTQRDTFHTVLEDNITQEYAERLGRILKGAEGKFSPIYARSLSSARHEESGLTWREMSARYWLAHEYPENPEIWHSVSSDKEPLREKFEDLYSRPLFANHIGAAAAISLHTNAEPSGQARGMRAYFQEGATESKKLANSVLCYMKERLHSVREFSEYSIRDYAEAENFAELRGSKMPAVLVEIGFHTNAQDAKLLKRWRFQDAAMTGLKKGYEQFLAGNACEPLSIKSASAGASAIDYAVGGDGNTVTVEFSGHPRFPLKIFAYHRNHVTGQGKCYPFAMWDTVKEPTADGKITVEAECPPLTTSPIATIAILDADGVRAISKVQLTCPGRQEDPSDVCIDDPIVCKCHPEDPDSDDISEADDGWNGRQWDADNRSKSPTP